MEQTSTGKRSEYLAEQVGESKVVSPVPSYLILDSTRIGSDGGGLILMIYVSVFAILWCLGAVLRCDGCLLNAIVLCE